MAEGKRGKPRRFGKIVLAVLSAILACVLLLALVMMILYLTGRNDLTGGDNPISVPTSLVDDVDEDDQTVIYKGQKYRYNENTISILFIGVDKTSVKQNKNYGHNGQADSLFLAVMDSNTGRIKLIPLSREAMVDVDLYTGAGAYAGVEKLQLCLAYAYGKNGDESCQNVCRSVSRLLYGAEIDSYVAIDLAGVGKLTDAVGGVKLTALETIPSAQPIIKEGKTVTLRGDRVNAYLQYRDQDPEANERRMRRQKQFLGSFLQTAAGILRKDITKVTGLYRKARPYIVTDLSVARVTYLATCALKGHADPEYILIDGQSVAGEKHAEFYPDKNSLYEAVLKAYYTPVEE